MYTVVFNDPEAWNDDVACGVGTDTTGGDGKRTVRLGSNAQSASSNTQEYSLYPNPNNGNIFVLQKNADNNAVSAQILDALGKQVYKEQLLFSAKKAQINLQGIMPGLYVLELRDSKGNDFMLKFVVQ